MTMVESAAKVARAAGKRRNEARPVTDPLRDEIAVRVMSTLISAAPREFLDHIANGHGEQSFKNIATISYAVSDAMMEARKR